VLDLPSETLHALDVTVPDDGTRIQPRTIAAKSFIRSTDMDYFNAAPLRNGRRCAMLARKPRGSADCTAPPKAAPDARHFLFHPTQSFEDQPDGSLLVRFRAGGALEMCWHLFTWGNQVKVIEPKRLATMLGRNAEALCRGQSGSEGTRHPSAH
jgi:WYL domain